MKRLALFLLLAGCGEENAEIPRPIPMTQDALSHFCMMQVSEHSGPKAQIHLHGLPQPIFFAQVRDGLAYFKGPERSASIAAIYVSDMGAAEAWDEPGESNWIVAQEAHFVVGAAVTGGMGAPEVAPFGTRDAAARFARQHGGAVMTLDQIPEEAVLGAVPISVSGETGS